MPKQKKSSDELSVCRKRLEHLWKSRTVDDGLLDRAWHTAYQVAMLLYEQFGANPSCSLWFTHRTDVVHENIGYRYRRVGSFP